MGFKGIDVRETGDRIVVRAFLLDSSGAKVTSGEASLYLYELQSDGSLKSFDFRDLTFKTTNLHSETLALTHQTGNNGQTNTGIWTGAFEVDRTLESSSSQWSSQSGDSFSSESSINEETEFTKGNIYIALVNHSSASPPWQGREFQYGEAEGDGLAAIADATLFRNWITAVAELEADGDSVPARSLIQAARFIRNKFSTTDNPGFVTVYEEDDATEAYQKALTTDPAAEPIVEG
jgi:hypothetical protein